MADYVELHCHSYYSLLDGASSIEDLLDRAVELGLPALALTDHNAVYGAPRFARLAQACGIRPIFGAELTLTSGAHLTLLVENERGWSNLCHLISLAQHQVAKGQAELQPEALRDHTKGLIALSGCRQGEVGRTLLKKDTQAALEAATRYRDLFGLDNFWLELQHHLQPEDGALIAQLVELAGCLGLGYVATNNVHYARRADKVLHDVLLCIRHRVTLAEAGPLLPDNSERYLKASAQLQPLFQAYPEALANTLHLAERCRFELIYGLQDLPAFPTPADLDATTYLKQLCQQAVSHHYIEPTDRVWTQLNHELAIIDRAGLANYFLIVWDIVRYAQSQGILCQGRGSAANSLVAYLLGISPIDPLAHDLVFERFLSGERALPPDIDLDFDAQRREEVIQYVYQRYGQTHASMACTFVTFRSRSALRDLGQVLDLPQAIVWQAAEVLRDPATPEPETTGPVLDLKQADAVELLVYLSRRIHGFPRHQGLHNGGMVVTRTPLSNRLPTEPATMPDRTVVQWDKDGLEDVGLIKIDLLGLRMLSAIAEANTLITEYTGQDPGLERLTFDDPAIYEMISQADTLGVFQVESRAQTQMLPRLQPRCFNDLIVAISLIRPGPIQGNMVHPYLRRRLGLEPVTYLHPDLEPALAETLGVILFQEQVLKVARDLAGFSAGQGEQLRRALGAKHAGEAIERFREAFLTGAGARGVPADVAETVFTQLRAFGGYAFAKSHAAAFAVLVYQSAWLKKYHPAAFLVALLNNQPMGFWNPAVLVGDARRHGLPIWPVDIHHSQARCIIEAGGIRLGFNYVAGLGEDASARLVATRKTGPFRNLPDFCRRTRLPRRIIENLIVIGAIDSWGPPRRKLLWELGQLRYAADELDLVFPDDGLTWPPFSPTEAMTLEYEVLGLLTGDHIITLYRPQLTKQGILGTQDLAKCTNGQRIRLAGLLVVHQAPPTAKNFHFLTLEDEAGLIDVIFRPQVYARYRQLVRTASLLVIEGVVQREGDVVNLLALRATALSRSGSGG